MGIAGQPFGAEKPFQPLKTDDLLARARFNMPVHAFGYNWLASCDEAGEALAEHIKALVKEYDSDPFWCQQVLLVTHSMGGLVARHCANLPGMADKIAGMVHGVMPSVGAAVAYRRCKVGMGDEDYAAGLVIGSNGQEVTAVFAQAPGALQLLPSKDYSAGWLRVESPDKPGYSWPVADPYKEVYRSSSWWSLVQYDWLSPAGGSPIYWPEFERNIDKADMFHQSISGMYHANSYVIYGDDKKQPSFETVTWKVRPGSSPDSQLRPSLSEVVALASGEVRHGGGATAYVGGRTEVQAAGGFVITYESSYWELHCEKQDGRGDGTVPASSGKAPGKSGAPGVLQQFAMSGFGHEPAFKNETVQRATLYAITRLASLAKKP